MNNAKGTRFSDHAIPQKMVSQLYDIYDYASFTVTDSTTDYDVADQVAALFKNVENAWLCRIDTNQDVTIKLNDDANPGIGLIAADGIYEFRDILKITNIFITNNSGSTATIKIFLV